MSLVSDYYITDHTALFASLRNFYKLSKFSSAFFVASCLIPVNPQVEEPFSLASLPSLRRLRRRLSGLLFVSCLISSGFLLLRLRSGRL